MEPDFVGTFLTEETTPVPIGNVACDPRSLWHVTRHRSGVQAHGLVSLTELGTEGPLGFGHGLVRHEDRVSVTYCEARGRTYLDGMLLVAAMADGTLSLSESISVMLARHGFGWRVPAIEVVRAAGEHVHQLIRDLLNDLGVGVWDDYPNAGGDWIDVALRTVQSEAGVWIPLLLAFERALSTRPDETLGFADPERLLDHPLSVAEVALLRVVAAPVAMVVHIENEEELRLLSADIICVLPQEIDNSPHLHALLSDLRSKSNDRALVWRITDARR